MGQLAWARFRRHQLAMTGGIVLAVMYILAIFAPFFALYPYEVSDRENFYHAPTRIHFRAGGHLTWPYVYATERDPATGTYREVQGRRYPIRLFVRSWSYTFLGLRSNLHLMGVDAPARLFLLGTDSLGRDQWSRLLYAGRISLFIGIVAVLITTVIGMLYGGIAGYYGGVVDNIMMRVAEVVMSVPTFYLLLALAAMMPAGLPSGQRFILIVAALSFVDWAGLSRVIRGQLLSLRELEYVQGARAIGASDLQIIVRHMLPNTLTYVIVAATLSIPGYILSESGLSLLGLGVQEPDASWGNMLSQGMNLVVLAQYPWLLLPGLAIFIAVLCFNLLGDGLRDALDPRTQL
ncbi:MAG: ABC transporter permease [Firmicutes bacterium]|nr:ABC transporter permease [Bacillota bacterium]